MKKGLSLLLALALVLTGIFAISASAKSDDAQVAPTGDGSKIYFDASTSGWTNFDLVMVYCYCPEDATNQIEWGSKKKGGMTDEGNGIWSFDFAAKGIELADNKQYCLIFNADGYAQTHDLLFDTTCFGDTAVPDAGNQVENPADSNKKSTVCRWKSGKLGPRLCITSIGNIVGEVVPAYTTKYAMFVNFLASNSADGLMNALNFQPDKTAQQLIDQTAACLNLTQADVKKAIAEAAEPDPASGREDYRNWSYDWEPSISTLPPGAQSETTVSGDPADPSKIYFDASKSGWSNFSLVMLYCYCPEDGDVLIEWGSRKKGGMTDEGNGIWSYNFDTRGISLEEGKQYSLIFNNDNGSQTHDLLFDTSCLGDTAVPEAGNLVENPADSNKTAMICRWKSGKLGPRLCITSIGHVVGEVVPSYTSPMGMMIDFLESDGVYGLQNALNYSAGKTAQQIIDEIAAALKLTRTDVEMAISDAATSGKDWNKDWDFNESTLPDEYPQGVRGDYDGDGEITIMDATRAQNIIAELMPRPDEAVLSSIDADGDGDLTIMDATRIQNVLAELMDMQGNKYVTSPA